MILLGHRGAPHWAPENTIASFHRAMDLGADGFEFDVRRSADGRLVVVHDPRVRSRIVSHTPAALLGLPLLEDVLREFSGAWLDIELKVPGIERPVLDLAARYLQPQRYVITSFQGKVIRELKRLAPHSPAGLLFKRPFFRFPSWAEKPHLDFLAPHCSFLSRRLCDGARQRGLGLISWTVNTPAALRRARDMKVDVVITDFPGRRELA